LSVEALHDSVDDDGETAVAARFAGTVGGVESAVALEDVLADAVTETVAAVPKFCELSSAMTVYV
jgi:hypothetical protein